LYIFNILNIQTDEILFSNDICECECECLIHKNHIVYVKLPHDNYIDLVKM
jgi:hypothetical protein